MFQRIVTFPVDFAGSSNGLQWQIPIYFHCGDFWCAPTSGAQRPASDGGARSAAPGGGSELKLYIYIYTHIHTYIYIYIYYRERYVYIYIYMYIYTNITHVSM